MQRGVTGLSLEASDINFTMASLTSARAASLAASKRAALACSRRVFSALLSTAEEYPE